MSETYYISKKSKAVGSSLHISDFINKSSLSNSLIGSKNKKPENHNNL